MKGSENNGEGSGEGVARLVWREATTDVALISQS